MNINFHREVSLGQLDISHLSSRYTVRSLREEDIPAMYDLCAGNPQYYEHCPPAVTFEGIRADMKALPPGKDYHDKYYIGFFAGEMLAAIMDLITGYPDDDTAWIGLFMVEQSVQQKGVGSGIIEEVCDCLKAAGFARVRLGYAKGNPQSEAFWLKNGFQKTGVERPAEGYTVVLMEKKFRTKR